MALDQRVGEPLAPEAPADQTARILQLCDRLLREIGRRHHLFTWLRGADGEWLPVDAYYPGKRLIVVVGAPDAPDGDCERLAAAHGLRVLLIVPEMLGDDPLPVLERQIGALALPERHVAALAPPEELEPPAPPSPEGPALTGAAMRASASPSARAAAAARGQRFVTAHRQLPRTSAVQSKAASMLMGLAIGAAIVIVVAMIALVVLT